MREEEEQVEEEQVEGGRRGKRERRRVGERQHKEQGEQVEKGKEGKEQEKQSVKSLVSQHDVINNGLMSSYTRARVRSPLCMRLCVCILPTHSAVNQTDGSEKHTTQPKTVCICVCVYVA